MKNFNVVPEEKEFNWGKMLVVSLGFRNKRRVLLPFHAGKDATLIEIGKTLKDAPKIIPSKSEEGWLAVFDTEAEEKKRLGSIYIPKEFIKNVSIVESGYTLGEGKAKWNKYLVKVTGESFICVDYTDGTQSWYYFGELDGADVAAKIDGCESKAEAKAWAKEHNIQF